MYHYFAGKDELLAAVVEAQLSGTLVNATIRAINRHAVFYEIA